MGIINFGDKNSALDVSWSAIVKIVLTFFVIYVTYLIKDILLLALFGIIISALVDPAVDFLQKFKISRGGAVFTVYASVFGFIGLLIYSLAPVFKIEIQQFALFFPVYFDKFAPYLANFGFDAFSSMASFTVATQDWLVGASSSIFGSLISLFGGIILAFTVCVMAIFFSLEERGIEKLITLLLPKKYEDPVLNIWKKTQTQISGWFSTRLAGAFAQGVLVSIMCLVLGIKYPILLGAVATFFGIIPLVGSLTSGAIITSFALFESWQMAVLVAALCVVISQAKNNILIPILSKKYTELPTSLVLISLLIGERLWGPVGAVLAIPMFGMLFDFTRDFLEKNKD